MPYFALTLCIFDPDILWVLSGFRAYAGILHYLPDAQLLGQVILSHRSCYVSSALLPKLREISLPDN